VSFEDVGDAGDLYTPSPVGRAITTAWCDGVEVAHDGPLRAALRVRYRMRVPRGLARDDGERFARPTRRAGRPAEPPVAVTLVLDAGSDALRVEVRGVNTARDHRLRLRFDTGLADARTMADAAFGPVERRPLVVPADEQRAERVLHTAPLHRLRLAGTRPTRGATVYSDGLAEYEAADDGAVFVTLVRAVGELSRPDLPERPGTPAGRRPRPRRSAWARSPRGSASPGTAATPRRCATRSPAGPTTCCCRWPAGPGARRSPPPHRSPGPRSRGKA
jgi:hypothetical protein